MNQDEGSKNSRIWFNSRQVFYPTQYCDTSKRIPYYVTRLYCACTDVYAHSQLCLVDINIMKDSDRTSKKNSTKPGMDETPESGR